MTTKLVDYVFLNNINLDVDVKLISTQESIEDQQKYISYTFKIKDITIIVKFYNYNTFEFGQICHDCINNHLDLPICRFYTSDNIDVGLITRKFDNNGKTHVLYYSCKYSDPIKIICNWMNKYKNICYFYKFIYYNHGISVGSDEIEYSKLYAPKIFPKLYTCSNLILFEPVIDNHKFSDEWSEIETSQSDF